jgi:hypothetical protein
MPQIHNRGFPHEFAKVVVVTTNLPTLGTNPSSKQHGSATQEAKDLGNLRSPRRTVQGDRADGPHGLDGRSAGQGRTVRK